MVSSVSLKLYSDLNNDGVVNLADRHMAEGGTDLNGDGKITTSDYFYARGCQKDYNGDGKINWLDVHQQKLLSQGKLVDADTNADGKLSLEEWNEYQYSKYDDVNNDGKKNWHDQWITKEMNKQGLSNAFELDRNNDGKIDTQDYWMNKGYEDYNFDGKVNEQDKVFKDTYGDVSYGTLNGDISNTNYAKLADKLDAYLPETVCNKKSQKKLNVLNYAVDRLATIQEKLNITPKEISASNIPGQNQEFILNNRHKMDAQLFNSTEQYFLGTQGSLKLRNKPVYTPCYQTPFYAPVCRPGYQMPTYSSVYFASYQTQTTTSQYFDAGKVLRLFGARSSYMQMLLTSLSNYKIF